TPADSLLASMPPVPEFPLTKTEPAEADISNKEPLEEESQTEREHLQPVVEKKQLEKKSTEGYVSEEKTAMEAASVEMMRELPEMETKTVNTAKKEESNKTAEKIYTSPEKMPRFSKGAAAFVQYLNENLNYPEKARERGITGRVLLNFIVEKDGEISNISVIQGIGGGCDEEAVAVMAKAPKWLPGEQNGEKVRVQCTIPITFALQ